MLGFLAGILWDIISYNGFQIPLAVWHLLGNVTGSA
jgi:hypothetical protein